MVCVPARVSAIKEVAILLSNLFYTRTNIHIVIHYVYTAYVKFYSRNRQRHALLKMPAEREREGCSQLSAFAVTVCFVFVRVTLELGCDNICLL